MGKNAREVLELFVVDLWPDKAWIRKVYASVHATTIRVYSERHEVNAVVPAECRTIGAFSVVERFREPDPLVSLRRHRLSTSQAEAWVMAHEDAQGQVKLHERRVSQAKATLATLVGAAPKSLAFLSPETAQAIVTGA